MSAPTPSGWAREFAVAALDAAGVEPPQGAVDKEYARPMYALLCALDAAREEGRQSCHDDRDHADSDIRAHYAASLGMQWDEDTTPCWDDVVEAARESGRREMRDAVLAAIKDAVDNGQHQMAHRLAAKDHDGALYLRGLDAGLVSLHYAVRSLTPADVAAPARKP